jgi:hypothetical protein
VRALTPSPGKEAVHLHPRRPFGRLDTSPQPALATDRDACSLAALGERPAEVRRVCAAPARVLVPYASAATRHLPHRVSRQLDAHAHARHGTQA